MPRARGRLAPQLPRLSGAALLLGALAIATGSCERPADGGRPSREALARMTPAERGALRARQDAAAGKLRVYRYGNPVALDNPRADPESGLPVRTLLDCCIGEEARAETEAYNRAMREEARARAGRAPAR